MAKKSGLGRGLDALFADNSADSSGAVSVRISQIEPNKNQPRKRFDTAALDELCESIKNYGILQPLVVRPISGGNYQLVAGERRWRAARMAELTEVPVVIKDLTDSEVTEIALIENLQREDLDPIEEALGYDNLMKTLDLTQDQAAKRVGKSRSAVANSLRLLGLPENVKKLVSEGKISASSARTLLSIPPEDMDRAVKMVLSGTTVRELESLARSSSSETKKNTSSVEKGNRDRIYDEAEISLSQLLGRTVKIKQKSRGGTLQIDFYNLDDLKELARSFEKNN